LQLLKVAHLLIILKRQMAVQVFKTVVVTLADQVVFLYQVVVQEEQAVAVQVEYYMLTQVDLWAEYYIQKFISLPVAAVVQDMSILQ
tara:strand:+ start:39 stop:299 length:261 start_codon:yes stop_codon:yes gene_type:complete